jgi:hypothetical protein
VCDTHAHSHRSSAVSTEGNGCVCSAAAVDRCIRPRGAPPRPQ